MLKSNENKSIVEKIMNDPQPLPRKVPDYMRKKGGLWYWTGAMVMAAFFYEAITGLILLFYYSPSNAYGSTESFLNNTPYGAVILITHLYGAYAMIVLVYLHLLRSLFVGAFKKPREMQWLIGVALLVLTLGVGFFGYSMIGDVLSIDAVDVGKGIAAGFPLIGWWFNLVFFGGGSSLSLFSRMLGWHIVLAAGIGVLFGLHFFLAEYNTIMPKVEKNADEAPLIDKETADYKPWFPYNLIYMLQIMLLVTGVIILIPSILAVLPNVPALFSPFPQAAPGTAAAGSVPPYPPWFLLFVYKELDFNFASAIGAFWGTILFTGLPLGYLLLLPKLDATKSLKMENRQLTVAFGIIGIIYLAGLSIWGALTPGLPIPDWQFLLFFAGIGVSVYLVTTFVLNGKKENKFKTKLPGVLVIMLTILGLSSFGSGMLIIASLRAASAATLIATILTIMIAAISAVTVAAIIKGILPFEKKLPKPITGKTYTFIGSAYAFGGIAILSIMMVIKPTDAYNSSLYGIGLGLVVIISGILLKIYRSYAYGE